MPIIRYTVFSAFKYLCSCCLNPSNWNLSIIGNINYLENKRSLNGVFFNQQHCPILVISNKVEFFDSLFYVMPANKLKTVPIRLIFSPDFQYSYCYLRKSYWLKYYNRPVTIWQFSSVNPVILTRVYTLFGGAPVRCGTYR